jgi:hypothetical protein
MAIAAAASVTRAANAIAAIVTAEPIQPEPQPPAAVQAQAGVVTGILRTSTGLPLEEVRIAVTPVDLSIGFNALEGLRLTGLTNSAGRWPRHCSRHLPTRSEWHGR